MILSPARWPVLKRYDQNHLQKIAMPLGGIGMGRLDWTENKMIRTGEALNLQIGRQQ